MQYLDLIQNGLDYIEQHLTADITAEELADRSGFSLSRYYSLFLKTVGIPVKQYITKRRLIYAINDISCGSKMIEAALRYGFDTHAGFYKAFEREFGCSPTEYLKRYPVQKPYRINLLREEPIMLKIQSIKQILAFWDLSNIEISPYYYESTGIKSDTEWNINDQYILKATPNPSGASNNIILLKNMAKAGFQDTAPIPTKNGQDLLQQGELYFYLIPKPKGVVFKSEDYYGPDGLTKAKLTGQTIGRLHLTLKEMKHDIICNEPNLYNDCCYWAADIVKKGLPTLPQVFFEEYQKAMGKLYPLLPKQLIHRNLTPSDIIYDSEQHAAFRDFSLSERNIRLFDPCYAATAILSESIQKLDAATIEKWPAILSEILSGYDTVCPLTEEEWRAVPYVINSIQLICIAHFEGQEKYSDLAQINKEMLCWLYCHADALLLHP